MSDLLAGIDREELDGVPAITCAVRANDFVIEYVNRAWRAFGQDNGATRPWGDGDSLLAAMADPLRTFYEEHFAMVVATGAPWDHDYECSSATLYRQFHLRAVVLGDRAGLLITHSLRVEQPHTGSAEALPGDSLALLYQAPTGLVSQCGHCRRVRRVPEPAMWDWVPQLVAHPGAHTTHGLCESCLAYYFSPGALAG